MAGRKKEELKLTSEQTERLIELYHSETDLWNNSANNYHNKDMRKKALEGILETMKAEFPNINGSTDQLWTKISNLRGYYSRELNKVRKSHKSGASTDEVYQSQWQHFKSLDSFLRAQITPRASQSNLDNSRLDEDDVDDGFEDTLSQTSEGSEDRFSIPNPKKKRMSGAEVLMTEAASVLADMKNKNTSTLRPTEDEDDVFGRYIASELRKIKDPQTKAFIKYKFNNLLFETQFGGMSAAPHAQSSASHTVMQSPTGNLYGLPDQSRSYTNL